MRMLLTMVPLGTLAAIGSVSAAQDSRDTAGRSYPLANFDEVSLVGPHRIVISVGSGYSVRVEGPQRTLDDTTVEVVDGQLKIHPIDDDRWNRGNVRERRELWDNYRPATFHVTLPRLDAVSLVGGGNVSVDRVEGRDFAASIAGSGDLDVATLRVDHARISVAGSGDVIARGSAGRSSVSIAGSGNVRTRELTSHDASVSIAGSGNAELTVEEHARVSIVGSGDVDIAGPARCSVSRFGGGRVRCRGETVIG